MSYDLYLQVRTGSPALDEQTFLDYFAERQHFEVNDNAVHYSNEDTGVYFHFYFNAGGDVDGSKNEGGNAPATISFNMNYYRPHTFGLEAVGIVADLVRQFDLVVNDPQSDGMGEGEFTEEGFLRGWNSGNRFAFRAISQIRSQGERAITRGSDGLVLPATLNAAYWRWNFSRERIGDSLADELIGVYVPPVWFCQENGQVRSFALFPNFIPTVIPRVDYVLVLRNQLPAPYANRSNETPAWVPWEDFLAQVEGFEFRQPEPEPGEEPHPEDHPHLILFHEDDYPSDDQVPRELAEWLIALPDWPGKPDSVRPDQILDQELTQPEPGEA